MTAVFFPTCKESALLTVSLLSSKKSYALKFMIVHRKKIPKYNYSHFTNF